MPAIGAYLRTGSGIRDIAFNSPSIGLGTAAFTAEGGVDSAVAEPLSSAPRLTANCCRTLFDTATIAPLPNETILPLITRSVFRVNRERSPIDSTARSTWASASPLPCESAPLASSVSVRVSASTSRNRIVPAYDALIGPTLTLTPPR